jgi:septal ring factor EnvC (AmiA/AmiB activator)
VRLQAIAITLAALAAAWPVPISAQARLPAAPADSAAAYQQRIQAEERKLKDLRDEIQGLRQRDRDLGRKERDTTAQLNKVQKEAALTADLLRQLEAKQARVEEQIDGIRAEHARASEDLAERKRRMARTLRAMYVRGTPTNAEVVLRTASIRYALSHFKYLGLVARNNERLVQEIRVQERYLAATDAKLTETLYEITTNAEEMRDEKERLGQIRVSRQSVLQRVRRQRADYQRAISDLAAAERKVQSMITVLEKRRAQALASGRGADVFPDVGFARLRGAMPWPTRGRVMTGYGRQKNPRHGTETFNSGIDIAAAEGTEVRCVARGQVEYVQWLDGYGKTIIVNHGGGFYTVYAHLSEAMVSESMALEPGHVIGRVGDTGSLDGTKLHFEVRAGEHGEPVDPLRWLVR